jgi:hypothetical protein
MTVQREIIDSEELARRWNLPVSWVRKHTWNGTQDPIPHLKFGRYTRFAWGDAALEKWLARRHNRSSLTR